MNKRRHSFAQRYKAFLPPESQDQSIISGHRLIWIGDLLNHLFQYFSIIKNKKNILTMTTCPLSFPIT